MGRLDWEDIGLHVIAAVVFTVMYLLAVRIAGATHLLWLGPVLNAVFWFVREVVQDINKGHRLLFVWPIRRSSQKDMEFVAPALASVAITFIAAVAGDLL